MSNKYSFYIREDEFKSNELRVVPVSDLACDAFNRNCKSVPAALKVADDTENQELSRAIRKAVGKTPGLQHLVHGGGS